MPSITRRPLDSHPSNHGDSPQVWQFPGLVSFTRSAVMAQVPPVLECGLAAQRNSKNRSGTAASRIQAGCGNGSHQMNKVCTDAAASGTQSCQPTLCWKAVPSLDADSLCTAAHSEHTVQPRAEGANKLACVRCSPEAHLQATQRRGRSAESPSLGRRGGASHAQCAPALPCSGPPRSRTGCPWTCLETSPPGARPPTASTSGPPPPPKTL